MKILITSVTYNGLIRNRIELISSLISSGNQVVIISNESKSSKYLEELGCVTHDILVHKESKSLHKNLSLLVKLFQIIRKENPDIIVSYTHKLNIYAGIVARILKIKFIATITGLGRAFHRVGIVKLIITFLLRISLKKADVIFTQNEENYKFVLKNNISKMNNVRLVNGSGVNLDNFPKSEYTYNNQIKFLFIGRLSVDKGFIELITAAKEVTSLNDDVTFTFVGEAYSQHIKKIVEENSNEKMLFLGYQNHENIPTIIAQHEIIVHPSHHEGMANALLEAGAIGRSVITTNISGCREALEEEYTGYLCRPNDPISLLQSILKYVALSPTERKNMGLRANRFISVNFDRKKIVKEYIEQINKCMEI